MDGVAGLNTKGGRRRYVDLSLFGSSNYFHLAIAFDSK